MEKSTPLIIAAKRGYPEIVDALLADGRADVNIRNKDKWSALIHACEKGRTDSVKSLLQHPDIQVNAFGGANSDDTALMFACNADRKFTKTVEALLEHPDIDVNVRNPTTGYTALMYATFKDYSRTVSALLRDPNIDVNMRRKENNMTALMIASDRACIKSLCALLEHPEINVYLKSKRGETAFDMATNEHTRTLLKQHMDANPAPAAQAPEPATSNTDSGAESQENDTEAENDEEETVAMTPRGASTWGRAHRVVDSQSQDRLFDGPSPAITTVRVALHDRMGAHLPTMETPSALSPRLTSGWLSKRLLDDAENPFPIELIQLCDDKLVREEGFACEQDFAHLPEAEFTGEYLTQIGILRKGLHIRLRRLHQDLRREYLQSGVKRPRTN
eukprot:gene15716-17962_t